MKGLFSVLAATIVTSAIASTSFAASYDILVQKKLRKVSVYGAPTVQLVGKEIRPMGTGAVLATVIFNVTIPVEGNLCGGDKNAVSYLSNRNVDGSETLEFYSANQINVSLIPQACQQSSMPVHLTVPVVSTVYVNTQNGAADTVYKIARVPSPKVMPVTFLIHQHISLEDQSVQYTVETTNN